MSEHENEQGAPKPEGVDPTHIQMNDGYRAVCLRIFQAFGFTDDEADLALMATPGTYAACRGNEPIWYSSESRLRLYNLWYMNNKAGWPTQVLSKYSRNGLRSNRGVHPMDLRRWVRAKQSTLKGNSPAACMCADKKLDSRAILNVYHIFGPAFLSQEVYHPELGIYYQASVDHK